MKRVARAAASFVLGFTFFVTGAAFAIESDNGIQSNVSFCFEVGKASESQGDCFCVKDTLSTIEELDCLVASGIVSTNEYEDYKRDITGQQEVQHQLPGSQCADIGKSSELDGDCFCVTGSISSMDEVDCLIASGIVGSDSYDTYRQILGLIPTPSEPEPVSTPIAESNTDLTPQPEPTSESAIIEEPNNN